ncbi:MAG: LysM peptidoglycan-binding domain-containing protein [Planctomycetes bacterium]|nr:LysM peptidoglycan-binding domain-containing protein [Planctomycetota bacterium]
MAEDMEYQEDHREVRRARGYPRFGSFFTIAVAILMLFGAASRIGKAPEIPVLFGIDQAEEQRLQRYDRQRTAIILGTVPGERSLRPGVGDSLRSANAVLPPIRLDADGYGGGLRPGISALGPAGLPGYETDDGVADAGGGGSIRAAGASGADAGTGGRVSDGGTYTVAAGDTWARIAKRFLGDASRWREIENANPQSRTGLKVGMRLVIPQ